MAEAGADFFYAHLDLPDPIALANVLRHPDQARRAHPGDPGELAQHGLRPSSRLNAAIHHVEDLGGEAFFADDRAATGRAARRSRPKDRLRDQIARIAGFDPGLGNPEKAPGNVNWHDIVRLMNRGLGRSQR
jgi:hypothetical protein